MKKQRKKAPPSFAVQGIAFLLLATALAVEAQGQGLVIRSETRELTGEGEVETGQALVQGRLFRAEITGDEPGSIVFDGALKTLTVINHEEQSFFEITAESMRKMMEGVGSQLEAAMKQMEAQLANLPPDQRRQVEAMMKQQLGNLGGAGGGEPRRVEIEVRPTGGTDSVGGLRCREMAVFIDGDKEQEVCVASWSSVGVDASAFEVFEDFGAFFEEITAALPQGPMTASFDNPFVAFRKLGGFPVRMRDFEGGRAEDEVTLTVAERRRIDSSEFEPPAGYRRVDPFAGAPR